MTDTDLMPETEPLPTRSQRTATVMLVEHVVDEEIRKQYNLDDDIERGFVISDKHYDTLALNLGDARAFNTTRKACEILMRNLEVTSLGFAFENGFEVTYRTQELN